MSNIKGKQSCACQHVSNKPSHFSSVDGFYICVIQLLLVVCARAPCFSLIILSFLLHGLFLDCFFKYLFTEIHITPSQYEAFNHYKKNTMSIEILKDDFLQKINFRVKNKVI